MFWLGSLRSGPGQASISELSDLRCHVAHHPVKPTTTLEPSGLCRPKGGGISHQWVGGKCLPFIGPWDQHEDRGMVTQVFSPDPSSPGRRGMWQIHPPLKALPGFSCFFHWELIPDPQNERCTPTQPPCLLFLSAAQHLLLWPGTACLCVCLHLTHERLKCRYHISFTQCLAHSRCSLNAY